MPVYNFVVAPDLDADTRHALALCITEAHCSTTGAPPEFVHVFFHDGRRARTDAVVDLRIAASVRAGRPDSVNRAIEQLFIEGARRTLPDQNIEARFTFRDTPAAWVMEGGAVLPEPGDEAAWMQTHWKREHHEVDSGR
ncbi:MAG: tautomerase family protein [Myxococcota bacterium]